MYRCIQVSKFGPSSVLEVTKRSQEFFKAGQGQVVIKVAAAGVNPVDTYIRSGAYAQLPQLPYVPGSDCSGVVVSCPINSRFKTGDRVYTVECSAGAYSELTLANESKVFPLPDSVQFEQGACLGVPAFTAFRALISKGKAASNETVLVHGASGGVGLFCCQMAKILGLNVIATVGSNEGEKLVTDHGADIVFRHNVDNYEQEILKATNGKGVDLIIEMLANVNLTRDCTLAARNGRIMVVGCRGSLDFNPRLTMAKELTITGVALRASHDSELSECADWLYHQLSANTIKAVIGKLYSLEQTQQAHDDIMSNNKTLGKLVIDIQSLTCNN